MILCPKCGKVKTYKIRQTVTREIIYSESGWMCDLKFVKERKSTPKCPKCGRKVKFFKDVEEVEDESKEDN